MYNNSCTGYAPACYGCRWREGFECRLTVPRLADDGQSCEDRQTEPPRRRRKESDQ